MPFRFYDTLMGISEMLKREIPFFFFFLIFFLFSPIPNSHPAPLFPPGREKKKKKLKWWHILHRSLALAVYSHSGAFLQV